MGVWFRRQNKVLHLVRYDEQACVARRMSNESAERQGQLTIKLIEL